MSAAPLLSVCIPTFNRARYLEQALDSITSQLRPGVEIVVADNASTDGTVDLVRKVAARFDAVRSIRHETNLGFDANYEACILAARGDACMTLGDDDWLEPGAIDRILELLAATEDLTGLTFLCNTYDAEGALLARAEGSGAIVHLEGAERILAHPGLGYYLANMSMHVFATARAKSLIRERPLLRNGCACHHLVCRIVATEQRWTYVDEPLTAWRSGNDSFAANGLLRRTKLALEGYEANVADAFGRDTAPFRRHMNDVQITVAKQFVLRSKNVARYTKNMRPYDCSPSERRRIDLAALRSLYRYPGYWLQVAPLSLAPGGVIVAAAEARRWLRRSLG